MGAFSSQGMRLSFCNILIFQVIYSPRSILESCCRIDSMSNQRITEKNSGLDYEEWQILKNLNTPQKIQDFLDKLKFDFADGYGIDRSVRGILRSKKVDCAGGAILASAALWVQGRKPLLLDLKAPHPHDYDHVVAVFKEGKYYGAISKTNHAVLRYREPIYTSVRELVMSYFHEYFLPTGEKTLRSYSVTFDLSQYGTKWLVDKEQVINLIHKLDHSPHKKILSDKQIKSLRKADRIEIKAGNIVQYKS